MMLANNTNLPELPTLMARSTWAILLAFAVSVANARGFDLMAFFAEIGAGTTQDEVIATGERAVSAWQLFMPIALATWAWIERRAPNFRLVFWRKPPELRMLGMGLWAALTIGLVLAAGVRAALADLPRCMGQADALAVLKTRFDEDLRWSGLITNGQLLAVTLAPDVTTGTALVIRPDGLACLLAAGESWAEKPAQAPGEDG